VEKYQLLDVVRPLQSLDERLLPPGVRHLEALLKLLMRRPALAPTVMRATRFGLSPASWQVIAHAAKYQNEERYDVIHAHWGTNALRAAMIKRIGLLKGPLISSFRGFDAMVLPNYVSDGYYEPVFEESTVITVSSNFMKGQLLELGAPLEKLRVIPNQCSLDGFEFRERGTSDSGATKLVFVGRLAEVKGIVFGIRAIRLLRDQGYDVGFSIVGDGPRREVLEAEVQRLGLEDCVTFHGRLSQSGVVKQLHMADIFVMPGVVASSGATEAFGNVVLEAAATGLPVVASDVGALPEVVDDGETGFVVPSRSPEKLAEAIAELIKSPEMRARFGQKARKKAEGLAVDDDGQDRFLSLYRELA
jgi:colanic acid/amylovoran biosynthesis glycosyltransferase